MVELFPDRGLATEEYYSVIGDERIEEHDPLYETGPEGRLGSFLIMTSEGQWIGYHYIEPARQWTRTYAGTDYEFVKKAHQLYVAQDRRMWDERTMTGEEETDQDVDTARDATPTMDNQSTDQ
jgi:hypothetical protein